MKFLNNISYLLLAVMLLVVGCGKDESSDPLEVAKFNYEYFPTTVGTYVEYDVNELNIELFVARTDTFFYHIREVIDTTFLDNEGRETQKIKQYKKETGDTEWKIENVWYSNRTTTSAERVEENIRYLKLIFPTVVDKEWQPNVYNSFDGNYTGPMVAKYESIDAKETIGNKTYNKVLEVSAEDTKTTLAHRTDTHKYAKDIGLVYRKYKEYKLREVYDSQNVLQGFEPDIYKELIMTATAYGTDAK